MVINLIRIIALSSLANLLLIQSALALTQVTATIDKNPVMEKESFVLQVTADDDMDTNALDTSPLLKNFMVGRTSVSSQTSMVNFKTTRITQWTTVLIPRSAGQFVIPSLHVDTLKTDPIALDVLKADSQNSAVSKDIFITTEISSKEVYVQQQLTLTIKLHFAAELKRGSLSEPNLAGASITQIGKDSETDQIINGKRYRVIERNYAINPQNSGDFTIKTPIFSGEIIAQSSRRNNFLNFADTKPVSVLGEDISLSVKPIPDSYQGVWLPSEIITLHQAWQPDSEIFKVGEPITRTITLTAAGLSEEQLPTLEVNVPAGIKGYPEQAELHTGMNQNRLVSQKKQNFALVASQVGTYELPEIRLPWWNTVTNRVQYAVIPAKTITIIPNDDMVNTPESINESNINNSQPNLPSLNNGNSPAEVQTVIVKEASWLQWLFLALWLLTSLAWLLSSLKKKSSKVNNTKPVNTQSYKALLNACNKHDAEQALKLITPWANEIFTEHNISTLNDALKIIKLAAFNHAITDIQECLYGKTIKPWQGDLLKSLIVEINKQPKASPNDSLNLNP